MKGGGLDEAMRGLELDDEVAELEEGEDEVMRSVEYDD
jgi:hypothetical protein